MARAVPVGFAACLVALAAGAAHGDDFDGATVIFARGPALYRVDPRGNAEVEIAQLPGKAIPRALRTDAAGRVLLVDLAGRWAWMPLDGRTRALTDLPCGDGPAQLADDGSAVVCRSPTAAQQSIIVELAAGPPRPIAVDVPPAGARFARTGAERALVWADATGVWTAPISDLKQRTRLAPDPPVRGFLASPDGERAIGVYADQVFSDVRHTRPAELLMTLALDGHGARRKAFRDGIAVEWSHDSQWVLVQDGASACIMRASGGQYKCWRGFTAASLSSDGRWGLVLGNRDGSKKQAPARPARPKKAAAPAAPRAAPAPAAPASAAAREPVPGEMPWDRIDEPSNEPEAEPTAEPPPAEDDVSVAPPSGPLSLFRIRLEGAYTDKPTLVVKVVDGAAVWVPGAH